MRFSTSIISLLALATSSLAMPAKRALPLQIRNFSVVDHSDVAYRSIQFSVTDPNTNVSEDCNLGWYLDHAPGLYPMTQCQGHHFEFGFRYGISNIEDFTLAIQEVSSGQTGFSVIDAHAKNSDWICTQNPTSDLKERCEWVGVLNVDL